MKNLGLLDRFDVDFVRREQHVGGGMTVEKEIALAIRGQRHKRQSCSRLLVHPYRPDIHTFTPERVDKKMTEGLVTDLTHESA